MDFWFVIGEGFCLLILIFMEDVNVLCFIVDIDEILLLVYEIVCILLCELFKEIILIGFVGVLWIVVIYMIVGCGIFD